MSDAPPAGLGLDQLLDYVGRAIQGDRRLLVALFRQMQHLAHHPSAPPEERRLGEILSLILIGDRRPNLDGLPADMGEEIRLWLERLQG